MDIVGFLATVRDWAATQTGIAGVLLVGSHARGQPRDDSDVDLVILTPNLDYYLKNPALLAHFGRIARQEHEDWGRLISVRTWYQSGLEVEFGFTDPGWAACPPDPGTRDVVSHGARIIFDRQGQLAKLCAVVSSGE